MIIVGEAAAKLERFDRVFQEKLPRLEEFQGLQKFYKNVVVKEIKEGAPGARTLTIDEIFAAPEHIEVLHGGHILNDIDAIISDRRYELLYLKNEVGGDFYTRALTEKILIACEFGEFAKTEAAFDPLVKIKDWEDKSLQILAKRLYAAARRDIERFYYQKESGAGGEIVWLFQKSVMALFLASYPRNLIRQFSPKGCGLYFNDFLSTLRELLSHREYQRYLLYHEKDLPPYVVELVHAVQSLVFSLYTLAPGRSEIGIVLHDLVDQKEAGRDFSKDHLAEYLKQSYERLVMRLLEHPSGPLFKAFDLLREEKRPNFDPWMLGNLPERQIDLLLGEKEISIIRVPAPIVQEEIKRASISEEFLTFLTVATSHAQTVLYIDFQDRTSWSEHARVRSIEGVSHEALFSDSFIYINLAKDTDFYNQAGIYQDLNDSQEFLSQLTAHLKDEGTGYYFPPEIHRHLFPHFLEKLIVDIDEHFFQNKKSLDLRQRLDFIELVYHFIALKIIEICRPDFITLTSKDGLDVGATSELGLVALIHYGKNNDWQTRDFERLRTTLLAPTLLFRERAVHADRFARLYDIIGTLDANKGYFKAFQGLYKNETLNLKIVKILPLIDKEESGA